MSSSVSDTPMRIHARDLFVYMPLPKYPEEAREFRHGGSRLAQGTAVCRLNLDPKGAVTSVQVVKSAGNKFLDAAATETLRKWRAKRGAPVRSVEIPIVFERGSTKSPPFDGLGFFKSSDVK